MQQSNYHAIMEFVARFTAFYGKLTPGFAEMLAEELQPFTDSQIRKGLRVICREKVHKPNISYITWVIGNIPPIEVVGGKRDPLDGELCNGHVCSCGWHWGTGVWTPAQKAGVYAWYRDRHRGGYNAKRQAWLESYVAAHGDVKPNV